MSRSRKPQRRRTPTKRAAPRATPAAKPVGNDDPTEPMTIEDEESAPTTTSAPAPEAEPSEGETTSPPAAEAPSEESPAEAPAAASEDEAAPAALETEPPVETATTESESPAEASPAASDVPAVEEEAVPAAPEGPTSEGEPPAETPAAESDDPAGSASPMASAIEAEADAAATPSEDPAVPLVEVEPGAATTPADGTPEIEASVDETPPVVAEEAKPAGRAPRSRGRRGRRPVAKPAPASTNGAAAPVTPVAEPEGSGEPVEPAALDEVPASEVEAETELVVVEETPSAAVEPEAEVPETPADETEPEDETDDETDSDDDEVVAVGAEGVPRGGGGRGNSRQRGLRAALATLPVPEPGPSFWVDIDRAMDEQPPLSITARPAIRPITEPPPLSQPSLTDHLGGSAVLVKAGDEAPADLDLDLPPLALPTARTASSSHSGGGSGHDDDRTRNETDPFRRFTDASRANTRKTAIIAVLVVMAILIAGNALNSRGNDDATGAQPNSSTTAPSSTSTTARPTTTVPSVPGLDPAAPLTPNGLGPLAIGTTLRDLKALGVKANVDQATFATSGGACYDVKVTGAPDLTLRFRSPDPDSGLASADDGELASIAITIAPGSARVSETGVRLGAGEQDVRNAHDGNVEVSSHPIHPGGHMMVNYAGDGRGVAYGTDGRVVTEIAVGYSEVITQRQGCS